MLSIQKLEDTLVVFQQIKELYNILAPLEQFKELEKPEFLVRNEGYKSFCNIAIWLTLYMMQNEAEQEQTITLVAKGSGREIEDIKNIITALAKDEIVINLMKNYGTKNISIKIRPNVYQTLIEGLEKNHNQLFDFLTKETDILRKASSRRPTYLGLEMKKTVDFQWRNCGTPFEISTGKFENSEIQYLESGAFDYQLVEYNDNWWLISDKGVYPRGCKEGALVAGSFAIATPLIPGADNIHIRKVLQSTNIYELYLVAKNSTEKLPEEGKAFTEENLAQLKCFQKVRSMSPCFAKSMQFPDLEDKFIGTGLECSGQQTIFSPFSNIPINKKQPEAIAVKYKFQLKYDKYGGEILNETTMCCCDGCPKREHTAYIITINQPYFVLYEDKLQAQDVKDVFPFLIGDPVGKTITKIKDDKIELMGGKPALSLSSTTAAIAATVNKLFQ